MHSLLMYLMATRGIIGSAATTADEGSGIKNYDHVAQLQAKRFQKKEL